MRMLSRAEPKEDAEGKVIAKKPIILVGLCLAALLVCSCETYKKGTDLWSSGKTKIYALSAVEKLSVLKVIEHMHQSKPSVFEIEGREQKIDSLDSFMEAIKKIDFGQYKDGIFVSFDEPGGTVNTLEALIDFCVSQNINLFSTEPTGSKKIIAWQAVEAVK